MADIVWKCLQRPHTKANPIILRSQLVLWTKTVLGDPNWFTRFGFKNFSPLSEVKFSFNGPEFAMAEGYSKIKKYKSEVPKLFWPLSMPLKWGHSNFLLFEIIFAWLLGYSSLFGFSVSAWHTILDVFFLSPTLHSFFFFLKRTIS